MKLPAGTMPIPDDSDPVAWHIARHIVRQGVVLGAGLLAAVALLIAVRRGVGAFRQPLSGSSLLLAGLVIAVSAWALRSAWRWATPSAQHGLLDRVVLAAPSGSLLLIALAISLPASPTWGLVACWVLVVGEESWVWRAWLPRPDRVASPTPGIGVPRAHDTTNDGAEPAPVQPDATEEVDPQLDLRQQLTRGIDAAGNDVLLGTLHAPITAGQRNADLHVAFCPPFTHTPAVEAYHADGPACRVNVPQVFPYGARIDVRLAEVAHAPTTIVLEIVARETACDDTATH